MMLKMQSYPSIVCLIFIFVALGSATVHGDPEPMARPTRPKVFTSPEELRRYLDLVRDYYSLSGKARYGKRGDVSSFIPNENRPWDALRTILDVRRQMQQQRQKDREDEKEQTLREFQRLDINKHASRTENTRPTYIFDMAAKYYDDVQ